MSAQPRRPSAITRLGLTGAPDRAAEVTPTAPASSPAPDTQPEAPAPSGGPPAGAWRRVVEVEARKYAAAQRRAQERREALALVLEQARAAGAGDAELRDGITAAGLAPEDWPKL